MLWYVAKNYKPEFMIDLATLTGAIIVALGTEYAGLFSNNDKLAERLIEAGQLTVGARAGECRSDRNTTNRSTPSSPT